MLSNIKRSILSSSTFGITFPSEIYLSNGTGLINFNNSGPILETGTTGTDEIIYLFCGLEYPGGSGFNFLWELDPSSDPGGVLSSDPELGDDYIALTVSGNLSQNYNYIVNCTVTDSFDISSISSIQVSVRFFPLSASNEIYDKEQTSTSTSFNEYIFRTPVTPLYYTLRIDQPLSGFCNIGSSPGSIDHFSGVTDGSGTFSVPIDTDIYVRISGGESGNLTSLDLTTDTNAPYVNFIHLGEGSF